MKRTLVPLELSTIKVRMKNTERLEDFESDLVKVCEHIVGLDKRNRRKILKKLKKLFILIK